MADQINNFDTGTTVEKNDETLADFLINSYKKSLKHEEAVIVKNAINDSNLGQMTDRFKELIFTGGKF